MEIADFRPTRMTLISLMFASMMILMGGAAVAPALPAISTVFPDSSEFVISLIVTLPSLAIALTGMGVGIIADRFGKVRTLVVSLIIFGVSGMSGYFLDDIGTILIGRFFVGVGIAGLTCSCTALLSEYYTGTMRAKILGIQAGAMGVGALVLELSGGILADISWRYPFLIYGMGFIIAIMVLASSKEPSTPIITEGHEGHHHRKADIGTISLCYVAILMAMFLMFAMPTKLTYYIIEMGGTTTLGGLFLGINGICSTILSMFYRRLSERFSALAMMTIGFFLFTMAYLLFVLPASYLTILMSVCIVGAGVGFIMPTVTNNLAKESSQRTSGKIMGGFTVMFYLGQFMSSLVLTPIIAFAGSYGCMFACLGAIAAVIFAAFLGKMMVISHRSKSVAH